MLLFTEEQLKAIRRVHPDHRMVHVDASGGIVHIQKQQREFNRIQNHVVLLKNMNKLDEPGINVIEMATSRQDMLPLTEMFEQLIFEYHKQFPNDKRLFRLLVSDYNFPTIHAALKVKYNTFTYHN